MINKSGLGLQKLVTSADEKLLSLQCASTELIRYVKGEDGFSTDDGLQAVKEEISDRIKTWYGVNNPKL